MLYLVFSWCLVFTCKSPSSLWIDGVKIPAMEVDPTIRFVHLHHCSIEVPNGIVAGALSAFGTVLDQFSCFAGPTVRNGSRVVKMSLQEEIPTRLFVLRYPCRVWYRSQVCNICSSSEHRAASCPLRDLCLKCRQHGHFARDCPGVPAHVSVADLPVAPSEESSLPVLSVPLRLLTRFFGTVPLLLILISPWHPRMLSAQFWLVVLLVASLLLISIVMMSVCQIAMSSANANDESSPVPASVLSRCGPFAVCRPDPGSPDSYLVFEFHKLTRRVVIEDSATFEMYRACFYSDNRGPFPVKSVFLPGRPVSTCHPSGPQWSSFRRKFSC